MILLDYKSRQPIYEQLYNSFVKMAALDVMHKGEQLPSVRILAQSLGINPNTVQKAYQLLERDGVIYSVPGKGSFIGETSRLGKERYTACLLYTSNTYSSPLLKILLIVNAALSLAFLVLMAVVCFAYYSYCSKTNYAAIAAAPRAEAYQGGYPPVQPNPYGGQYAPYGQPQQPQPNQQGQNGQNPYYGTPYGGQPLSLIHI